MSGNQEEENIEPSPVYLGTNHEKYKENPLRHFEQRFKVQDPDQPEDLSDDSQKKFVTPGKSDLKTLNALFDVTISHRDKKNLKVLHMF